MKKKSPQKTPAAPAEFRQRNALGKASREQIVQAAERLLKTDGYHTLSTRKVAEACGISVGNLTYHFPNKALLIEALITAVLERYERQRAEIKFDHTQTPENYLRQLIHWLLQDAVDPDTSALFLELWVLAKHHEFSAEILERFYSTAIGWICKALQVYFPSADEKQRESAAYFILTLSEGSVAVFSRPHRRPISQKDIGEVAVHALLATLA